MKPSFFSLKRKNFNYYIDNIRNDNFMLNKAISLNYALKYFKQQAQLAYSNVDINYYNNLYKDVKGCTKINLLNEALYDYINFKYMHIGAPFLYKDKSFKRSDTHSYNLCVIKNLYMVIELPYSIYFTQAHYFDHYSLNNRICPQQFIAIGKLLQLLNYYNVDISGIYHTASENNFNYAFDTKNLYDRFKIFQKTFPNTTINTLFNTTVDFDALSKKYNSIIIIYDPYDKKLKAFISEAIDKNTLDKEAYFLEAKKIKECIIISKYTDIAMTQYFPEYFINNIAMLIKYNCFVDDYNINTQFVKTKINKLKQKIISKPPSRLKVLLYKAFWKNKKNFIADLVQPYTLDFIENSKINILYNNDNDI